MKMCHPPGASATCTPGCRTDPAQKWCRANRYHGCGGYAPDSLEAMMTVWQGKDRKRSGAGVDAGYNEIVFDLQAAASSQT